MKGNNERKRKVSRRVRKLKHASTGPSNSISQVIPYLKNHIYYDIAFILESQ